MTFAVAIKKRVVLLLPCLLKRATVGLGKNIRRKR
jgi:hypothetical protein